MVVENAEKTNSAAWSVLILASPASTPYRSLAMAEANAASRPLRAEMASVNLNGTPEVSRGGGGGCTEVGQRGAFEADVVGGSDDGGGELEALVRHYVVEDLGGGGGNVVCLCDHGGEKWALVGKCAVGARCRLLLSKVSRPLAKPD